MSCWANVCQSVCVYCTICCKVPETSASWGQVIFSVDKLSFLMSSCKEKIPTLIPKYSCYKRLWTLIFVSVNANMLSDFHIRHNCSQTPSDYTIPRHIHDHSWFRLEELSQTFVYNTNPLMSHSKLNHDQALLVTISFWLNIWSVFLAEFIEFI